MSHDEHTPLPEGYPVQPVEERVYVKTGIMWASAVGLVTLIVVSLGLVRAFELALDTEHKEVHPNQPRDESQLDAGSAPLNPAQVAVKKAYLERQHELLTTYGWANTDHTKVRVPIAKAMDLVVEKYGASK